MQPRALALGLKHAEINPSGAKEQVRACFWVAQRFERCHHRVALMAALAPEGKQFEVKSTFVDSNVHKSS